MVKLNKKTLQQCISEVNLLQKDRIDFTKKEENRTLNQTNDYTSERLNCC